MAWRSPRIAARAASSSGLSCSGRYLIRIELRADEARLDSVEDISTDELGFIRSFRSCGDRSQDVVFTTGYDNAVRRTKNGELQPREEYDQVVAIGVTRGGAIVIVDARKIFVGSARDNGRQLSCEHNLRHRAHDIEAVLTSQYRDRFVLFFRDGRMIEYEIVSL